MKALAGILCGATASGKTALALALAKRLPLEVVSADSRQVFRHLDIGTAKPSAAERADLPHHLIDFVDLESSYNAARFAEDARRLFDDIRARQRLPLVVGGAGFYLKVLREGLFEAPFSSEELERVRADVASWSTDAMQRELAARDPQRLAAIHPNDRYRLSRALEICIASGKSVTQLTQERQAEQPNFVEFHLHVPRDTLHERIAARTDAMLQQGWTAEVEELLRKFNPELAGFSTLGYPHVMAHVQGRLEPAAMRELIVRDTRRYARHQDVWFRKLKAAIRLELGDADCVDRMESALGAAPT